MNNFRFHLSVAIGTLTVIGSAAPSVLATDAVKQPGAKAEAPTNQIGYVGMNVTGSKVTRVFKDTPAFDAQLAAGDEIESIDRVPTAKMAADEPARRMKGPLNSSFSLVVKRGGQRYTCNLKRALTADALDKREHPIQETQSSWKGPPGAHY